MPRPRVCPPRLAATVVPYLRDLHALGVRTIVDATAACSGAHRACCSSCRKRAACRFLHRRSGAVAGGVGWRMAGLRRHRLGHLRPPPRPGRRGAAPPTVGAAPPLARRQRLPRRWTAAARFPSAPHLVPLPPRRRGAVGRGDRPVARRQSLEGLGRRRPTSSGLSCGLRPEACGLMRPAACRHCASATRASCPRGILDACPIRLQARRGVRRRLSPASSPRPRTRPCSPWRTLNGDGRPAVESSTSAAARAETPCRSPARAGTSSAPTCRGRCSLRR